MSDKDLIKREEVADKAFEILKMLTEAERHGKIDRALFSLLYHDIGAIALVPAAPHEMSAREFVIAHHRMCQSKMECVECRICHDDGEPRSCAVLMGLNPDDTVAVVEAWAQEHPERSEE